MKRTIATVALGVGALLVTACGGTAGNATVQTNAATQSAQSSATSGASSTAESTESSEESTEKSTDESTGESTEESTLGGNEDSIDAQTTAWFDTFCTAMKPAAELKDLQSKIDPAKPSEAYKVVADAMQKMGGAFTDAGTKLKDAPPPTFEGGSEFAGKIVTSFTDLGPKFTKLGDTFAKADPNDPASRQQLATLGTDLQQAAEPLQELSKLKMSAGVSAAIAQIPSCAALNG